MKKIIALLLALSMLFALTACGGNDESTPTGESTGETTSTTESTTNTTDGTEDSTQGTTEGTTGSNTTDTSEPSTTTPPTTTPPTTTPPTTEAPHTHSYSSKVTTAATCGKEGIKTFTCSCGSSYTEKIAATSQHSWKDATCTAPKTCKNCGATKGSALGHNFNAATCTSPKTCKTCGATEGSAIGHNWQDATYSKPKTCKVCGATEGSKLSPVIAPGDKAAPELVSFTLNKTNVKVGDVITFTAEIKDSSTIYYAEFQFKCGADWHNVFLDNVGGNIYSGTLKITDSFVSGTYSISWISIQDYAGNTAGPSSNASFTVNNPNSTIVIAPGDKTAPELISFTLDKTNVKVGDTITFTAEIKDSSTIDYAEFQFKCGADWHNVFLDNVGGNIYSGTLKITDSFVSGTYSISWISIQDYAGNTAGPSSNASFTVNNPNSTIVIAPGDKTAPELISFTLDKTNVKVGDTITFTAEIKDSSTIDYAEFQFKCGADWHNVFLDNVGGNIYSGTLKITDSFVSGTYSISWISIQDYAGNTAGPSSNASFTVVQ